MDIELLLEAEKRGILPPDKVELLAEARRRGLVPGGEQKQKDYFSRVSDEIYRNWGIIQEEEKKANQQSIGQQIQNPNLQQPLRQAIS